MKRIASFLLTTVLTLSISISALAADGPAKHYDQYNTTDPGAWSYVKIHPVSGQVSRTHYLFSNYQTTSMPIEGIVDKVSGYTYNKKSNTLTINKINEEDMIINAHNMGTGFKIVFKGKNTFRSIKVTNENWDSGLTLSGDVTLGNKGDHNNVPLDVYGDLTITSGTIKCIAEETEIQSAAGLRYTVQVRGTSSYPLMTALKYKGDLTGTATDAGTWLVTSKDTITFSGKAISTKPSPKRSGKTVKWSKKSGYKYQYKIGSKIKTTTKTSVKSAKKVQVRYIKIKDGIMKVGAWSKKV